MAGTTAFVIEGFARQFGSPEGVRVFRAPGRVNLIGEHTDYNLGFVLPVAIDLACLTATAANREGLLRVYSENLKERREWSVSEIPMLKPSRHWTDYIIGVAQQLLRHGCSIKPRDLFIHSTVPEGGGLSSSAALEVSAALALRCGIAIEPVELAQLCRRAEVEFVGLPSGIMDQYAAIFGHENAAIELDCRTLESRPVPLPAGMEIIAVNTMVKHELGKSAYGDRVKECQLAVASIRKHNPRVESLRDLRSGDIEALKASMDQTAYKRALHVTTENERVKAFVSAAERGKAATMGALAVASHRSLQHDYEVSCEELDFLVDLAVELPGVYGARMTGGGFGGCTVNFLETEAAAVFRGKITGAYRTRFGIEPEIYTCRPSGGAAELTWEVSKQDELL